MKKTYIIPVTEVTRLETQTITSLSVTDGSTTTLKNDYATEGADALTNGFGVYDDWDVLDDDWRK